MKADDLVILLDGRLIRSCRALREELDRIDRDATIRVSVMRGTELMEFTLGAAKP
jgi:hypothetical protein